MVSPPPRPRKAGEAQAHLLSQPRRRELVSALRSERRGPLSSSLKDCAAGARLRNPMTASRLVSMFLREHASSPLLVLGSSLGLGAMRAFIARLLRAPMSIHRIQPNTVRCCFVAWHRMERSFENSRGTLWKLWVGWV